MPLGYKRIATRVSKGTLEFGTTQYFYFSSNQENEFRRISIIFTNTGFAHRRGKKKTPWVPFFLIEDCRGQKFSFRVVQFRLMAQNSITLLKQQGVSGLFLKAKCKKVSFLKFSFCVHREDLISKGMFDILAPSAFV